MKQEIIRFGSVAACAIMSLCKLLIFTLEISAYVVHIFHKTKEISKQGSRQIRISVNHREKDFFLSFFQKYLKEGIDMIMIFTPSICLG